MDATPHRPEQRDSRLQKFGEVAHRAFEEFLRFPLLIIAIFLLLAAASTALDYARIGWLEPLRNDIRVFLFRNPQATSGLLGTVAGSIITVTSITFSLLLLAVQQAAAALTPAVYDQFLRRRVNQVYFGFFVGLALYTLVILATVNPPYNPIMGASLDLLLTIIALSLIVLLLYTTINQMRPVVVINTIHDHVLAARECQLDLLARARRAPQLEDRKATPVRATAHGYVVRLELDGLAEATKKTGAAFEIVLQVAIGSYVAFDDTVATIRAASPQDAALVAKALRAAIILEQQRDLEYDPAYCIEHLGIIGWTSISTAKSNPAPGVRVLRSLRDVLARWSAERAEKDRGKPAVEILPVVYTDNVFPALLDTFETLAVVASESMQPQTIAEFLRTFALMFARLPAEQQPRAENLIRTSLSALGEHVLTAELDAALSDLQHALEVAGRDGTANEVRGAHQAMRASIGKLGSRATRVSSAKQ